MDTVRTPDDRFTDLPGYPFEPHYAEIPDGDSGTLRVHYLDEGRSNGPVVLLCTVSHRGATSIAT